jgi:tRNA(Arg) A34 adenosine deaminase TadA
MTSAGGGSDPDTGQRNSIGSAMCAAIGVAREGAAADEYPYGAVVMDPEGDIIARAHDEAVARHDPTAHSELLAVQRALRARAADLRGCTLVCTVEPCAMCFQAAWWAGVGALVFGVEMREIVERYPGVIEEVVIDCAALNALATRRLAVTQGILHDDCLGLWAEGAR